ncbi:MAG TPA: peptide deformylase [Gemmatimonadaceae bacterium]|nr:peptide deformylase [Gemmatimonadaceae bacterium]
MKLLDIRVLGDPILRRETELVTDITDELRSLVADMFTTMHAAEGIGLAAPQVGRAERVAVVDVEGTTLTLINPEIIVSSGAGKAEEGCLSIPEVYGEVTRPETIVVRATDLQGDRFELEAGQLAARCIQHEIDHLHGKLFIDYLGLFKRRSALAEWERQKVKYPGLIRKIIPGAEPSRRRTTADHATTHTPEQTGEM